MKKRALRREGFEAGLRFGSRCPYPPGSEEAHEWEIGWADGVHSRDDPGNYRDTPSEPTWKRLLRKVFHRH